VAKKTVLKFTIYTGFDQALEVRIVNSNSKQLRKTLKIHALGYTFLHGKHS